MRVLPHGVGTISRGYRFQTPSFTPSPLSHITHTAGGWKGFPKKKKEVTPMPLFPGVPRWAGRRWNSKIGLNAPQRNDHTAATQADKWEFMLHSIWVKPFFIFGAVLFRLLFLGLNGRAHVSHKRSHTHTHTHKHRGEIERIPIFPSCCQTKDANALLPGMEVVTAEQTLCVCRGGGRRPTCPKVITKHHKANTEPVEEDKSHIKNSTSSDEEMRMIFPKFLLKLLRDHLSSISSLLSSHPEPRPTT